MASIFYDPFFMYLMHFIYQVVSTEKIVSNMSAIVKEVAAVVDQQIPSSTVCRNKHQNVKKILRYNNDILGTQK